MLRRISYLVLCVLFTVSINAQTQKITQTQKKIETKSAAIDRNELILFAKKYIGTPYCYASNDPQKGFDCSGFVNFVFKNFHINVPRSSKEFKNLSTPLRPEEFKIGDVLVFYGYKDRSDVGHLGIICEANGMQSKFIHSSSGKVMGVTISELGSEMYTQRFYKCIDVIK